MSTSKKATATMVAMRPVIVKAHSAEYCNCKAVSKEMCLGASVPQSAFIDWCKDVEKLRLAVCEYVDLKHKVEKPEDEVITKAQNAIFPLWKKCLGYGEEGVDEHELRATEHDVSSLVGYAEKFMGSSRGTQICHAPKSDFRRKVESLVGCRIARNDVLTDGDRDLIQRYESALKSKTTLNQQSEDLTNQLASWEKLLTSIANEPKYIEFVNSQIAEVKLQQKANNERKSSNAATIAECEAKAKAVLEKLNEIQ